MLHNLNVYDNFYPKVRLGNPYDGGYVASIISIGASQALFSYGIGGDISFEKDYCLLTAKKAYCFDHTVGGIRVDNPALGVLDSVVAESVRDKLIFKKEGLSGEDKEDTKHFFTHYAESKIEGRVLLKMDVEGCEYEFFEKTDLEKLSKITTGIIIECHNLNSKETYENLLSLLEKLNKYFYIVHLHGNNYGGEEEYFHKGVAYTVPHFLEISFISKEVCPTAKISDGPHPDPRLDCKNELGKKELSLEFLKLARQ